MLRIQVGTAILFFSCIGTAHAQCTEIFDGDFFEGDWSFYLDNDSSGIGEYEVWRQDEHGNPDAQLVTYHRYWENTSFSVGHTNVANVVDLLAGGIERIDISFDLRAQDVNFSGLAQRYLVSVFQNDIEYSTDIVIPLANTLKWRHHEWFGLTSMDFHQAGIPDLHPDFSGSGAPLLFAYITANTADGHLGERRTQTGIDNWTVRIHRGNKPDTDCDMVVDADDNCIFVSNSDQRDTDQDGFGNICDGDLNNDCSINFEDLAIFIPAFFTQPGDDDWNEDADLDGDDQINFGELQIIETLFFGAPGPSGIAGCPVAVASHARGLL